jgi:hypothetical protein
MSHFILADKNPKKRQTSGENINPREIIEKANDVKKEYYRIVEQTGSSPVVSPTPTVPPEKVSKDGSEDF